MEKITVEKTVTVDLIRFDDEESKIRNANYQIVRLVETLKKVESGDLNVYI